LGNRAPQLKACPHETVVAEKYQALVHLGLANSRMKDFYDLWVIAHKFDFDSLTLSEAIRNTFSRRRTPLPEQIPSGLSSEFHEDAHKNIQWHAFMRKGALLHPTLFNRGMPFPGKISSSTNAGVGGKSGLLSMGTDSIEKARISPVNRVCPN